MPRWQPKDFLQMFYGPITEEENISLPQPGKPDVIEIEEIFTLARRNNFQEWPRVWKMIVSEENENNNDLLLFARATKAQFTDLVEREIRKLKSVKVSFGLKAKFSIERNGETEYMGHYFREEEPHVFNRHDKELIKEEFDRFVERANGEIEG